MQTKIFKIPYQMLIIILSIFFLIFIGSGCIIIPTPTGNITGIVTENLTNEPLEGVLVSVGNYSTETDVLGNYILNDISIGIKEVTVALDGYFSQDKTVEVVENETIELNFQLNPFSDLFKRAVMVELFVKVDCGPCTLAEPILEQLAEEYGPSQMILVEEHIFDDYEVEEAKSRYYWYISSGHGTPDTLFNGLNQRILGLSTYDNYKDAIEAERKKAAKIYISASKEEGTSTITISGDVKNISSFSLNNLVINGMIFEDRGETGLRYLVLDIFEGKEISSIAPEETISFSFTSEELSWLNNNKVHGVIYVQAPDSSTKEILQALYVE